MRVLDFDVVDDTPFLVMDYAPNGTLRQRHPKGTILPLSTIIAYVKQIADALQYAHDQRLIHRDIKPENMLAGQRNELLLSDFGIAIVAQSSRYQGTQDMAGTIAYMAPEQIQAHPRSASDQYSLGIVVYEWLSGDRPFQGSYSEIAVKHTIVPPPSLREKIPTLSPAVEQVVLTALAKDSKQRFASAQAFATALEQASQAKQVLRSAPTLQATTPTPTALPVAPPSGEKIDATERRDEKVNVWRIGKREVVATIVGTILCSIPLPWSAFLLSIGPLSNTVSRDFTVTVLLCLAFATLLFFGTVFGPWVGLFMGGVGMLIFGAFSRDLNEIWFADFGIAVVGFIAGLTLLLTKGRYNKFRAIATALGINIIGLFVGGGIAVIIEYVSCHSFCVLPPVAAIVAPIFALPSLILFSIMLIIYNRIVSRRQRA